MLPDDELADDDFESEDGLESDEDEVDDFVSVELDDFAVEAGLLLDDEPRLSLR
ncbi:hypothetical protein GCM10010515_10670 [Streptomyces fructofermentans]|uniref:Uncharacterized protein n=1 Tax=Streptomyces fructofermentans TaxID=152141 RepID=A0A918K3J7_9ACTN|nr:hypothetical protein GCM10010515_10670 [Streptomyces fructofermentans]